MAHVHLPPPDHREMIEFCVERFRSYHIFISSDGQFYETNDYGSHNVPINHVRCMLARDLHAQFFVTSKIRKLIIDKVIEAVFKWAEMKGRENEA